MSTVDHVTDVIKKFLARFVLAGQDELECRQAIPRAHALSEKFSEFVSLIPGKQRNLAKKILELARNQRAVSPLLMIGQIAAGEKPDRSVRECNTAVLELLLVLQCLLRGMQQITVRLRRRLIIPGGLSDCRSEVVTGKTDGASVGGVCARQCDLSRPLWQRGPVPAILL
jgi:hypothetical protein